LNKIFKPAFWGAWFSSLLPIRDEALKQIIRLSWARFSAHSGESQGEADYDDAFLNGGNRCTKSKAAQKRGNNLPILCCGYFRKFWVAWRGRKDERIHVGIGKTARFSILRVN